jgi:hypothetical protein
MEKELFKDPNFIVLLDSIRLHTGTTRAAQKQYDKHPTPQNRNSKNNCEKYLDSLLHQASKIIIDSGTLTLF